MLDLSGNESSVPQYFFASFNPIHVQDALAALLTLIGAQFGAFVLVLAALGLYGAWRRDWRVALVLFATCTTALLFSVTYPNEGDVGRYRLLTLFLVVPSIGSIAFAQTPGLRAAAARVVLVLFLFAGAAQALRAQDGFFHHAPGEGGRWVIDAVRPYVPPGSIILVDWLDATPLAYAAYADGSLPGRIVVSGSAPANIANYPVWANDHRVFILVDPHGIADLPKARLVATLDAYHALWQAQR